MSNVSDHDTDYFENPNANAFGASDRGRVRETNQDQYLIAQLNKSMLVSSTTLPLEERLFGNVQGEVLLVADGMGGHAAGEKASRLAIVHLVRRMLNSVHWFFQGDGDREKEFVQNLQFLLKDAHARLLLESSRNMDQRGMGTTLTMALLVGQRMYVVHAGDSRCYLIRDGVAQQLTTDHTLAQQMVESGGLKPEEESKSQWSNVLWNVLGGHADEELIAEVRRVDLESDDLIVLCSDGLYRYVGKDRLAEVVSEAGSPEVACRQLLGIALESGGEDNITVVVSRPASEDDSHATWVDLDTVAPQ